MSNYKKDAQDSLFIDQELESVKDEVYIQYPIGKYASLVPVDSSDDEGAESVGYLQFDSVGQSAIIAAGDTDSPSVDAFVKKILLPVHEIGNHFKWDTREVRNSRMAGRKLDAIKARVAAQVTEAYHDKICMLGDGTNDREFGGMYGIVFHPNVSKISSSKTFATATNAEILKYFSDMVVKIVKDTKEVYRPDTFAMSDVVIAELRGRVLDATTRTLWDQIKETYSGFKFETHYTLENVGKNPTSGDVADTRVILCYKKDKSVLRYKMPMPYKLLPTVFTGREWKTETSSTSAGVEVRQPLAVVVFHSF
jgi:hypothetical protein